jgi:hypothetical protein
MEILEKISEAVDSLKMDTNKFYTNKNKSAGVRARKTAQALKSLMQDLRKDILEKSKD